MTAAPARDVAAALRSSRLFAHLPEADLAELARTSRTVELAAGEVLMAEGSPPEGMYVVLDGELEVSRNVGGSDVPLHAFGPGERIGELRLRHRLPPPPPGRARIRSRVPRHGADAFEQPLNPPT